MNDEQRNHLETLLHTYQRRLRLLEQQVATFGPRTPPEVRIELADVAAEVARISAELQADPLRSLLHQRWYAALTAFYAQRWGEAATLLADVQTLHPGYQDVAERLAAAQRQQGFQEFYAHLCAMRAEDEWLAVLNALAELEQQFPGFRDEAGLRQWAERRRRRAQDTKLCPACGELNPATYALCLRCGRRIV